MANNIHLPPQINPKDQWRKLHEARIELAGTGIGANHAMTVRSPPDRSTSDAIMLEVAETFMRMLEIETPWFITYENGPWRGVPHADVLFKLPKRQRARVKVYGRRYFRVAVIVVQKRHGLRGAWNVRIQKIREDGVERRAAYAVKQSRHDLMNYDRWDLRVM